MSEQCLYFEDFEVGTCFTSPSLIALLGIQSWRFLGPLKIGDTIHLEVEIVEKEETSKPESRPT